VNRTVARRTVNKKDSGEESGKRTAASRTVTRKQLQRG